MAAPVCGVSDLLSPPQLLTAAVVVLEDCLNELEDCLEESCCVTKYKAKQKNVRVDISC